MKYINDRLEIDGNIQVFVTDDPELIFTEGYTYPNALEYERCNKVAVFIKSRRGEKQYRDYSCSRLLYERNKEAFHRTLFSWIKKEINYEPTAK